MNINCNDNMLNGCRYSNAMNKLSAAAPDSSFAEPRGVVIIRKDITTMSLKAFSRINLFLSSRDQFRFSLALRSILNLSEAGCRDITRVYQIASEILSINRSLKQRENHPTSKKSIRTSTLYINLCKRLNEAPPTSLTRLYFMNCNREVENARDISNNAKNSKALTETFFTRILHPHFRALFYQRIRKIWFETNFYMPHVNFAERLVRGSPDNILVTQAIEEELRIIMLQNMGKFLHHGVRHPNPCWIKQAEALYRILPQKDRAAISAILERDIIQWASNNSFSPRSLKIIRDYAIPPEADLSPGSNYIERCLHREPNINVNTVLSAIQEYLMRGPLSYTPNLGMYCDESMKFPFFEVKDAAGKTRAHILGSAHLLPSGFLRFRQIIWQAFAQSTAYMNEHTLEDDGGYFPEHKRFFLEDRNPSWPNFFEEETDPVLPEVCFMDRELELLAKRQGKEVLSAEENGNKRTRDVRKRMAPGLIQRHLSPTQKWQYEVKLGENIRKGDLEFIDITLMVSEYRPEFREQYIQEILFNRNVEQSSSLHWFLHREPQSTLFMTVGAAHLCDFPNCPGVLTLLRQRGWTVKKI